MDTTRGPRTVAAIRDAGGEAVPSFGDVADFNAAESIVRTALDTYGDLDVLVNVR